MDALQKQQQQYQSFRQLNTAKAYETEQLVMNVPTNPVVILPTSNGEDAATAVTTTQPDVSSGYITESASATTAAPSMDSASTQKQPWSSGWNGNNNSGNNIRNPSIPQTPKANYMYQKKEDLNRSNTNYIESATATAATPLPTFGTTIPPPPQPLQQQAPPTTEAIRTDGSGNEGRPVFPSYVYSQSTSSESVPTTVNAATATTSSTRDGDQIGSTVTPVSSETTANSIVSKPDLISSSSSSSGLNGIDQGWTTGAKLSLEQSNQSANTIPEPYKNLLEEKSLVSATEKPSSLWEEYISQRRNSGMDSNQNNYVPPEPQQHGSSSKPSSVPLSPTEEISSISDTDNVISSTSTKTNEMTVNTNYDEKNDPEPLKFNFMGRASSTVNTAPDSTATFTLNEDEQKIDATSTIFSNESFLKAITTVETVSSNPTIPEQSQMSKSRENAATERTPATSNPLQLFWESNMSRFQKIGTSTTERDIGSKAPMEVPPTPYLDTRGMTERIMRRIDERQPIAAAGGAGGSTTYTAFQKVEENWTKLKQQSPSRKSVSATTNIHRSSMAPFVTSDAALGNPKCWTKLREQASTTSSVVQLDYDIVVCGGTLGIFFALALLLRNPKFRICVVESAPAIRGREQEWNISLTELYELIKLGVLTESDLDDIITTEFPACRSGFKNKEVTPLDGGYFDNNIGYECATDGVLNLGVSPSILLERVAARFRDLGGVIREDTRLFGVTVSDTVGAALDIGDSNEPITTNLLMDCMGNASPISRQQRDGIKPDGVCAVVGSCAAGFDPVSNVQGDIIYTMDPIQDKGENGKLQYFWEAFPVGIGRNGIAPGTSNVKTTYMFTYMDADENRPSLETIFEDYWRMLPKYQPSISNPETDLDVKRVLFAYFPTFTDSPLKPHFSRILPVGDASGIQSPLSFGGFGALTRHLDRITTAVEEALNQDLLQKEYLGEINAYAPNLSAAWMFQKAMSIKMGQKVDEKFVNRLLAVNFEVMNNMGQRTIKPFLQDVIRFDGLVGSLARGFIADPTFMPEIVLHVGIPRLVDWLGHVSMMGLYAALDSFASPIMKPLVNNMKDPAEQFLWRRRMDAWKFGCGNDYELPKEN